MRFVGAFSGVLGLFVVAVVILPAFTIPLLATGWFAAGFVADQPGDERPTHRRRAQVIVGVHLLLVAPLWLSTTPEIVGPQSLAIAVALGCGVGLAAGGLSLIGMDARRHARGQP